MADITTDSEGEMRVLFEAHAHVLSHTLSIARPLSFRCAAELGIADVLHSHGGAMHLSDLAPAIRVPPERTPMLRRLMRLLVHSGVFATEKPAAAAEQQEEEDCRYLLTPVSRLLVNGGAGHVLGVLRQDLVASYNSLSAWLRGAAGYAPFEVTHGGRSLWSLADEKPELNEVFNEAMACNTRWTMRAAFAGQPGVFRGLRSLVDVGGGNGTAARMIAEAFPEVECIVFDLPHVVAGAAEIPGMRTFAGDMFEYIPQAQAIFFKNIFHNWGDEECVKILKKCKEAIPSKEAGGKVIIVDVVMNFYHEHILTEIQLYYDMHMMSVVGGKEREEHEWRKIFNDAGFSDYKVVPILAKEAIIEVFP